MFLKDSVATEAAGAALAKQVRAPAAVYLEGALGAGKTTFAKGFLQGLGCEILVKSPTFTLLETYVVSTTTVIHADFYRIKTPDELESMGFREYFQENNILLIEWASRVEEWLPKPTFLCMLKPSVDRKGRWLEVIS